MPSTSQSITFRKRLHIGASLVAPLVVLWWASRRGWMPVNPWWCLLGMPVAVLLGVIFPRAFTGWYQLFSSTQSWLGRQLLSLLLGLVYVLVVIPMGVILRATGKSFLDGPRASSYWKSPRNPGSLKQQF